MNEMIRVDYTFREIDFDDLKILTWNRIIFNVSETIS